MDPWVRDHATSVEEGERAVDRIMAEVSDRIVSAVRAEGEGPISPDARTRLMRRVDAALDAAFGIERGGGSPLESAIVRGANRARVRAIRRGFGPIAREIERKHPDLAEALDADRR